MTTSTYPCAACGGSSKHSGPKQTRQWCRRCGGNLSDRAEHATEVQRQCNTLGVSTKRERVLAIWADFFALLALAGLALAL